MAIYRAAHVAMDLLTITPSLLYLNCILLPYLHGDFCALFHVCYRVKRVLTWKLHVQHYIAEQFILAITGMHFTFG